MAHKFGKEGLPLKYVTTVPNLFHGETRKAFIAELKASDAAMRERYGVPLRFVNFDTFATCFSVPDRKRRAGRDRGDQGHARNLHRDRHGGPCRPPLRQRPDGRHARELGTAGQCRRVIFTQQGRHGLCHWIRRVGQSESAQSRASAPLRASRSP
jgi:hypothetical protein